jgi:hypothetical protein
MRRLLAGHRVACDALVARRPEATDGPSPRPATDASPWTPALCISTDDAGALPRLVAALRRAEDDCLDAYAHALGDGRLSSSDRVLLLAVLLPEQRTHEALLSAIDERTAVM